MVQLEIELLRKAAALYVLCAERVVASMLNTFTRCTAGDEEYLRARSEAVVAARTAGQADIVPVIMSVDEQIQAAWAAHAVMWEGIAGDTAEISGPRQEAFLESIADCIVGLRRATDRLDATAGLHKPIETRVFSEWTDTAKVQKLANNGDSMTSTTWQRIRKELPDDIESHPTSGTKKVRLTKAAADRLGISLQEFEKLCRK